ncbi:hypothetical protein SAMN04487917_102428 [Arthrobacter sp. yr096]|uniref:hypothetical protein n=1 Tax=unclassified Arthrobacter TaxID=235627 RepID=UPI000894F92A|nr:MULTISPECIES: hypothetical protein [unclassified Arthrobacter]SDW02451.1 hypothetical protein SAMN04487912_101167 [Arthrobacter sp. cf158]SEI78747.1 hypothetical protein SAMN04487917_102428 [Arthrobacter sp. yr096]
MNSSVRPSPGLMVIIVFCMTVLLGIGGTAAFALWEQSSHGAGAGQTVESAPSATSAP